MTKGRNIKNFVKSPPLFDVHWAVSLDVFDRFTGRNFEVTLSNFSLFCLFSQNLARLSGFIFYKSFISYPLVIFLHLWSFENNLSKLDFSISKETCFYGQTFSGTLIFCTDMKYVFEILAPFYVSKHF